MGSNEREVLWQAKSDGARCQRMRGAKAADKSGAAEPVFDMQRHAGNHAVAQAMMGLHSSGEPLDMETRAFFEPRLGIDLGGVRVHTGTEAAQSARAIDARAYTDGEHVVFDAAAFEPKSSTGRHLLAHELAHVAQNRRNPSRAVVSRQGAHGDVFDRIAQQIFGRTDYADYLAKDLVATSFLGRRVQQVHPDVVAKLKIVEADLTNSQGPGYQAPPISRTLSPRAATHGLGMAIDFDVDKNPYVLNEAGEKQLDQQLGVAYDHIAQFILGKAHSDVNKVSRGRSAFSSTPGVPAPMSDIYDALREESDAMVRYFALMKDAVKLADFLTNEWPAKHASQTAPAIAAVQTQMRDDYEVVGGKTASGAKRPTQKGQGDRPFAPASGPASGDPATGFLNLPKEFVLAMTNAGFAWGAVDFLGGVSGDIQHFDLRLSGTGNRVARMMGAVP